jgi:PAS domain S-box-containing protein
MSEQDINTERMFAHHEIEQSALYKLSDRLHRSEELADAYSAALDAMHEALHCERASILLLDEDGFMQFVASQGLSDPYRDAVAGHSPWTADEKSPAPICIPNVAEAELPDDLLRAIQLEGIRALSFVPLLTGGKLIGKFMIYRNEPHEFTDDEMALALTIARQFTFGMQRIRVESERNQAEDALRENEQQLRMIFNQSNVGIAQIDASGCYVLVNDRFCEITGYTREELRVRTYEHITHPEDVSRNRELVNELLRSWSPQVIEKRYVRPDGTYVWVSNNVSIINDKSGKPKSILAISIDITERVKWEAEQSRLAAIVNSSEDAIVSKDLDGIVTSWNKAAERIYGWKAEEIIGKSKAVVIPSDLPNELPTILERIKTGKPIEHYETFRLRKNGERFDVDVTVSPLKDVAGHIVGASTIARDISERKRTERELQRKQEEVRALNERLKWAMRETHHRVKNNLQVIAAMIDLQLIDIDPSQASQASELSRLGGHVRALASVHDLLTHYLNESDEGVEALSIQAIYDRLIPLLRQTSGPRDITVHGSDIVITGQQATALALITNELVSNAMKHGAGNVSIETISTAGSGLVLFRDFGNGFRPDFDPELSANTGLQLVESLVSTNLSGQVNYVNAPGGGAEVRVGFPIAATTSGSHVEVSQ